MSLQRLIWNVSNAILVDTFTGFVVRTGCAASLFQMLRSDYTYSFSSFYIVNVFFSQQQHIIHGCIS